MERRICIELKQMNQRLNHLFYQNAMALGIDEAEFVHAFIIIYLQRNQDKVIYQKTLEQQLCIQKSSMSSTLSLLETKGYIKRLSIHDDKRKKQVILTEEGNKFADRIYQGIELTESQLTKNLSTQQLDNFMECINQFKLNCNIERTSND